MSGARAKTLPERVDFSEIEREIELLREKDKYQQTVIQDQAFQISQLRKIVFGKSSERTKIKNEPAEGQQTFLNVIVDHPAKEAEREDEESPSEKKPRRRRKTRVCHLPVREFVVDVPEDKKFDEHGEALVILGYEKSTKICREPGVMYQLVTKRPVYGYKDSRERVYVPEIEKSIIPKGRLSDDFILQIVTDKYFKSLPLYRQAQIYNSQGAGVARSTLSDAVKGFAKFYAPIAEAIRRQCLQSHFLHMDETPLQYQLHKEAIKRGYMWAMRDTRQVYFHFGTTRSNKEVKEMLRLHSPPPDTDDLYWHGYLMADDHGAYAKALDELHYILMSCWAHARRKFNELKDINELAAILLEQINKLYTVETDAKKAAKKEKMNPQQFYEYRGKIRRERSAKIIDELQQQIIQAELQVLPRSAIGRAVGYVRKLLPQLRVYLKDGSLPIDNNAVEGSIKGLVVGRKNWLFCGSEDAGAWAAVCYSITESCRMQAINPFEYLRYVTSKIHESENPDYDQLTPYSLRKIIQKIPVNF